MKRICVNPECNWIGPVEECHCYKHDPSYFLCPKCHDSTEEISDEEAKAETKGEQMMTIDDGIIHIAEPMTDEQVAELKRRWEEMWRGAAGQAEQIVIWGKSPLVAATPVVLASMEVEKKTHELLKGEQSMRKDEPA